MIGLVWLLVPGLRGAPVSPRRRSRSSSNPIDAFFESVSGFTATGATVLVDIEALDRSILLWRQFSHWLGGMGIIVLAVAVLPRLRIGGRQMLQSELAGPTEIERFTETIRETARRLWTLYAGLTVVAVVALAATGWFGLDPEMTLFDAVAQALSVVSLGGFSSRNDLGLRLRARHAVRDARPDLRGGHQLPAHVPRVRAAAPDVLATDEELRLYVVFAAARRGAGDFELLVGDEGPARPPSGTAPSRRCRS